MKEGAFILVDCLGFRGIWNRIEPEKLISRLHAIEQQATSRVVPKYSSSMLSFGPLAPHIRLLSDTVVLSLQYADAAYSNGAEPNERQKIFLYLSPVNVHPSWLGYSSTVKFPSFFEDASPLGGISVMVIL